MLDQIRRDIQSRLDELLGEVDKLRRALAALTSRDGADTSANAKASAAAAKASADKASASGTDAPASKPETRERTASRSTGASSRKPTVATPVAPARTAPGATKAAVIGALAGGEPMTAGEIAAATGLGRATISTTLSKLAKTGEVTKADRGYLVPKTDASPSADGAGVEEAATAAE